MPVNHIMYSGFLEVAIPIICLMLNVVVQVASFRFTSGLSLLKSILLGFIVGGFSLFAFELCIFITMSTSIKDFLCFLLINFAIYAALGYCYFHFINLGETARRIRILSELYDYKEGLSMDAILERYNARNIVEMRINRLLKNNQILCKNGKYYIDKSIMLSIAKILTAIKLIVLKKGNELG